MRCFVQHQHIKLPWYSLQNSVLYTEAYGVFTVQLSRWGVERDFNLLDSSHDFKYATIYILISAKCKCFYRPKKAQCILVHLFLDLFFNQQECNIFNVIVKLLRNVISKMPMDNKVYIEQQYSWKRCRHRFHDEPFRRFTKWLANTKHCDLGQIAAFKIYERDSFWFDFHKNLHVILSKEKLDQYVKNLEVWNFTENSA